MFHKGDRVFYTATMEPDYPYNIGGERRDGGVLNFEVAFSPNCNHNHNTKCLIRWKLDVPRPGIVIGKTYRAIGQYSPSNRYGATMYEDWDPASLNEYDRIPLWMVITDNGSDRYFAPILVHESDLIKEILDA